jgi:hypothetical protein
MAAGYGTARANMGVAQVPTLIHYGVLAVGYGTARANMGVSQVRQYTTGCWLLDTAQPALTWEFPRYVNPPRSASCRLWHSQR